MLSSIIYHQQDIFLIGYGYLERAVLNHNVFDLANDVLDLAR